MNHKGAVLLAAGIVLLLGQMLLLSTAAATPLLEGQTNSDKIRLGIEDEGRHVALSEDQVLIVGLETNPSTGYLWEVAEIDPTVVRWSQDGEPEFEWGSGQRGVGGKQLLRFKAMGDGVSTVKLVYHRPWQHDVPPRRTFTVQVQGVGPFTGANVPTATPVPSLSPAPVVMEETQATSAITGLALPTAFNWCDQGGCTPVKDQGECGTCWAFAAVGVLESLIRIKDGAVRDLSEQYLVSCNTDGWGCNGGLWAHDYHKDKIPPGEPEAGAVSEADFPYQAADLPCNPPHAHQQKITSWHYVGSGWGIPSVADIKQAIYDYGPVAVGICTGTAFDRYSSGVFDTDESSSCRPYATNHAVLLVGWDDSQGTWHLRNSWGTSWGESGYMHIKYGVSSVGEEANYVVYGGSPPPTPAPTGVPTPTHTPTPLHIRAAYYLPIVLKNSDGTVPTPQPSPTSAPTPSAVVNGDFESGQTGWLEYSWQGWDLIMPVQDLPNYVSPHSGKWAAWLGGDDFETSYIEQQVTVPATGPYLVYWHWIDSTDYCGYDFGGVVVNSSTVVDVYDLCAAEDTGGWVKHVVNLSAYKGQSVSLQLRAETDWSDSSSLFIDDVSFQSSASAGPNPSYPGDRDAVISKQGKPAPMASVGGPAGQRGEAPARLLDR